MTGALAWGAALLAEAPPARAVSPQACAPEAFGAAADGVRDDRAALQRAIDTCAAKGGGEVRLASGRTYLSSPIELRSGITLRLERGAVLLGTADHRAYAPGLGGRGVRPLVGGDGVHDVAIVGEGTIDGQGSTWWPEARRLKAQGIEPPRPRLVQISNVRNLRVAGVTLQNSAMFHLVPSRAENVVIENVTIRAPADSPNTDGIDPAAARHVVIRNATIDVGDDHIAIKAGQPDPAHPGAASADILIEDCVFLHGHGLSIGSETVGGVRGVTARRIRFDGADTALRIKTPRGRGGEVSGVVYRDITARNVKTAMLFTAYYPKIPPSDAAQPLTPTTPDIHDISVERFTAVEGVARAGGVYGLPERPVRRVRLQDVRIEASKPLEVRHAELSGQARIEAAGGPGVAPGEGAKVELAAP